MAELLKVEPRLHEEGSDDTAMHCRCGIRLFGGGVGERVTCN
jgi:hypothetical protein